jgi:hypothetical protein
MSLRATSERRALAIDHVERGRATVARQRRLITEIRDRRGDSSHAEELLATFERSLAIFEDDLRDIERRQRAQG